MLSSLPTLIARLDTSELIHSGVISWGCPVPVFGNLGKSSVATLGINPSNLEFVDEDGNELSGQFRRFHTLQSLVLPSWGCVDATHLRVILESFDEYFNRNPYDRWFKRLDEVLSGAGVSFYDKQSDVLPIFASNKLACHLDLVPYATKGKWTELTPHQREILLRFGGNCLGQLLRDSAVEYVICNGRSVIQQLEFMADIELDSEELPGGELPRRSLPDVKGFVYRGILNNLCGVDLGRDVCVLGFNHNLQSSFGVTNKVVRTITAWIAAQINGEER